MLKVGSLMYSLQSFLYACICRRLTSQTSDQIFALRDLSQTQSHCIHLAIVPEVLQKLT